MNDKGVRYLSDLPCIVQCFWPVLVLSNFEVAEIFPQNI